MDVFGRTPVSMQNKLFEDSRRFLENILNNHDVIITEQLEKITDLITTVQTLENKISLQETASLNLETRIEENMRKLNDTIFELSLVTEQMTSLEKSLLVLVDHVDNIIEKPK